MVVVRTARAREIFESICRKIVKFSRYVDPVRLPPPDTATIIWDPPPSVALPTPPCGASASFCPSAPANDVDVQPDSLPRKV
jgi:hypothetical protein